MAAAAAAADDDDDDDGSEDVRNAQKKTLDEKLPKCTASANMKRQTSGFKNMLSCFGPPPELMMHRWLQISCNCVALLTTCS